MRAAEERGKVAGVVADWLVRGYDLEERWIEKGLKEVSELKAGRGYFPHVNL